MSSHKGSGLGKTLIATGGILAVLLSAEVGQETYSADLNENNTSSSIVIQQQGDLSAKVKEITDIVNSKGMLSYVTIAGEEYDINELDTKNYNVQVGEKIFAIFKKERGNRLAFIDFKKDGIIDVYVKMKSYPSDQTRIEVLDNAYELNNKQEKNKTIGREKYFLINGDKKINEKYVNLVTEALKAIKS